MIKARPPPSTKLDGSLFLVRHLLILKEVARRVGLSTAGSTVDSATGKVGGPGGMLSPGRVEEFRTGSSPSGVTGMSSFVRALNPGVERARIQEP